MNFSDFVGLGSEIEQLMRSVRTGRISHAYLIAGARGSGKRTLANLLVQALFCTGEEKPCSACPACKRFLSGNHPDVRTVRAKGKSISVEEIRNLIDYLSNKPYEGGYHAVVVEDADRMTVSAQNALLKTLESPAGDTVFFLLTDAPSSLLSTVRSRCVPVRMPVLSREMCREVLLRHGVSPEQTDMLAGYAMGSVGRALEAVEDDAVFALRDRVLRSAKALRGPESVRQAAEPLAEEKDRSDAVLNFLELLAGDRMAIQNGAEPQAFSQDELRDVSLDGAKLMREVMLVRRECNSNVSWQFALERMYFSLAGAQDAGHGRSL